MVSQQGVMALITPLFSLLSSFFRLAVTHISVFRDMYMSHIPETNAINTVINDAVPIESSFIASVFGQFENMTCSGVEPGTTSRGPSRGLISQGGSVCAKQDFANTHPAR